MLLLRRNIRYVIWAGATLVGEGRMTGQGKALKVCSTTKRRLQEDSKDVSFTIFYRLGIAR